MGCDIIQGYYLSKPQTADKYKTKERVQRINGINGFFSRSQTPFGNALRDALRRPTERFLKK
jgi:hypothetical protein